MNNSLNILIVEDELLISEMLKEMVEELGHSVIGQAKNGAEAFKGLNNDINIDIVLLDINLGDAKSGVEIAKEISEKYHLPFIFITSYSDKKTLQEAAATKPIGYIIKPFKLRDIQTTLIMFQGSKEASIIIKDGHLKVRLSESNIYCVKSENNYLEIFSTEKKYVIRQSLDSFLEELNSHNLVRIHRSYVVNVNHVEAVNGQYLLIKGEKIPLSRKYRNEVLARFSS